MRLHTGGALVSWDPLIPLRSCSRSVTVVVIKAAPPLKGRHKGQIISKLPIAKALSRRPFLGQVVHTDLLLCTGFDSAHAVLILCHIFTQSQGQRPMNDRKIERSDGRCFGRQQLLAHSMEISFPMKKKKSLSRPDMYKALKPF